MRAFKPGTSQVQLRFKPGSTQVQPRMHELCSSSALPLLYHPYRGSAGYYELDSRGTGNLAVRGNDAGEEGKALGFGDGGKKKLTLG